MFSWKRLSYVDLSDSNVEASMVQLMLDCNWNTILGLNMSDNPLGCLGYKELVKGSWPML